MFLMALRVQCPRWDRAIHWVRRYHYHRLIHLDLLFHWVRPLLTALRYLMGQQFLLDRRFHLDRMCRLDLSPRSVQPLLKHQHFRWVRGHRLVRGPLTDLRYLMGRKFHLGLWDLWGLWDRRHR